MSAISFLRSCPLFLSFVLRSSLGKHTSTEVKCCILQEFRNFRSLLLSSDRKRFHFNLEIAVFLCDLFSLALNVSCKCHRNWSYAKPKVKRKIFFFMVQNADSFGDVKYNCHLPTPTLCNFRSGF
jgi:hypothetical protein